MATSVEDGQRSQCAWCGLLANCSYMLSCEFMYDMHQENRNTFIKVMLLCALSAQFIDSISPGMDMEWSYQLKNRILDCV